jgi:guanylate kinase
MFPKKSLGSDIDMSALRKKHPSSGRLFVISAPSGAGKSTICKAVIDKIPNLTYSVSFTTRKPRGKEENGIDYHFVSIDEFLVGIQEGIWAEWAQVHGNYYGTSANLIDEILNSGSDVLLDIDVQGASQIVQRYPESITIFIMPPSVVVLRERLLKRATDSREDVEQRLVNAEHEMAQARNFHHVIINDRLNDAIEELTTIITSDRAKGKVAR